MQILRGEGDDEKGGEEKAGCGRDLKSEIHRECGAVVRGWRGMEK